MHEGGVHKSATWLAVVGVVVLIGGILVAALCGVTHRTCSSSITWERIPPAAGQSRPAPSAHVTNSPSASLAAEKPTAASSHCGVAPAGPESGAQLRVREEVETCGQSFKWTLGVALALGLVMTLPWFLALLPNGSSLRTPFGELHGGAGGAAASKSDIAMAAIASLAAGRVDGGPSESTP